MPGDLLCAFCCPEFNVGSVCSGVMIIAVGPIMTELVYTSQIKVDPVLGLTVDGNLSGTIEVLLIDQKISSKVTEILHVVQWFGSAS